MESVLFYIFSGIAIISALMVVLQSRPTRALLSLIVTMFALAVLFLLLGGQFIAMIHLIVYAGAVLVLFLFVIMLQGIGAKEIPLTERFPGIHTLLSILLPLGLVTLFVFVLLPSALQPVQAFYGGFESVGFALFLDYLLPFELTSILLLLGVFAAVALAKKEAQE